MSIASQVIALMYNLPPAENGVRHQRNLDVPSEDGIILKTDLYFPRASGPHPTILMRNPYKRRSFSMVADLYAERGYIVVLQAVRGTDGSTGTFNPLTHERVDGLATIDWIKKQDWFDGRLGLNGPSYLGYCALAVIDAVPPGGAASIKATSADFERIVFPSGAFHLQLWLSWIQTIYGLHSNRLLGMTMRMISGDIERRTTEIGKTLPLQDADVAAVGKKVPFWRDWMEHAIGNHAFWAERNHTERLNEKTIPTSFVTGWYDLMADGHLADYQRMVAAGHRPQLTIGNWHHTDNELQGESLRQSFEWFDTHLLGKKDRLRKKPVRIFVSGSERWHDLDAFPPATVAHPLYLGGGGVLSRMADDEPEPARFTYDPADPTPSVGGPMFAFAGAGPQVNNDLEARKDVLTFTSAPLSQDLTIVGNATARLYVRSSLPYADFFVRICDVGEDRTSINIADAIIRLTRETHQPDADRVCALELKLSATGHTFLAGHSIRLQVSGGAHPRYARNLGTDEPIATATRMLASKREVLMDETHQSRIDLPVWQPN